MVGKLDAYADTLAELMDAGVSAGAALKRISDDLLADGVSAPDLLSHFETVYLCSTSEYEDNLKEDSTWMDGNDTLLDTEFDSI